MKTIYTKTITITNKEVKQQTIKLYSYDEKTWSSSIEDLNQSLDRIEKMVKLGAVNEAVDDSIDG